MNIWMFMNYAREGESHLIISDQASVRDQLNIYQTESTLCTAKPGYRRFQIYSKAFNLCASVYANDYVTAQTCIHDLFSPIQAWQWINNRQLRHEHTGKCLDIVNGIVIRDRLCVRTCNSTRKSQQWACDGLFFEVGGTKLKMNYGNVGMPHILLYNVYADGQYSKWIIYQTPDSSLCSINPYNDLFSKKILKITTVALKAFCSIECAKEQRCKAYIFLEFKKSENCLLSSDPDGKSIPYYGLSFVKLSNDQECDINYCQSGSTCVRRCTEPFFECVCPSWASGDLCENLNPDCSRCLAPETLLHVVAGCQSYLERFTWRHDSVLNFLATSVQIVSGSHLYVDLPGSKSPSIITGDTYRPDLLIQPQPEHSILSNLQLSSNQIFKKKLSGKNQNIKN
ncbi:macrophage mannose receptor 1-like [Paramuricea clavata]|uniref:Macrophage mannose receptor 1-like n=1 Tax=Paramuricea clavata TaxID=317549 RepID=A0A7D9HX45_PARCT|nr:macrophage mannose receptor 1-like [Paramuricea clavata]